MASDSDQGALAKASDSSGLGGVFLLAAAAATVGVGIPWFFVQLCGLGENRSELYNQRCESGQYNEIPLLGFLMLALAVAAAKLVNRPWIAWVGLPLALIPGLITWNLFSV